MSDSNIPDVQVRQTSIKTSVVISPKFFGTQNINFREILSNVGTPVSNQVTQSVSSQGANINMDFLYLGRPDTENTETDEQRPTIEKNFSPAVKVKNEEDNSTVIYSKFNPQKTTGIDEKTFSFSSLPEQDFYAKNELLKENLSSLKETEKKLTEKRVYVNSDNDTFAYHEKAATTELVLYKPEETSPEQLLSEPEYQELHDENSDKEGQQNKKKKNNSEEQAARQEELESEALKIIDVYGLNTTRPKKVHPNSNKFTIWLSKAVLEAGKRALTIEDSEKLAKYVVSNYKFLPYDEKELFYRTFLNLFQHKISSIRESYLVRTDKQSLEIFLRIFPNEFVHGFIKKLIGDNTGKKRRKIIARLMNKIISAVPINNHEAGILLSLAGNELSENDNDTFKNIFKGRFEKLADEKIYKVLSAIYKNDFKVPGFVGCIHEILIESFKENKTQTTRQLVRILETYYERKEFSKAEANLISSLIAGRYFNNKNINSKKVSEIFSSIISKQETEYYKLDLIYQLSGKNPLAYLPVTVNKDIKNYLKALPVTDDEIILAEETVPDVETVKVFGKIKLFEAGQPLNLMKPRFSIWDNVNGGLYNVDIYDNYFIIELQKGDYSFDNITINKKKLNLGNFLDEYSFLTFAVEHTDSYYYGNLNIYLDKKDKITKISLKNEPKDIKRSFLEKYQINMKPEMMSYEKH